MALSLPREADTAWLRAKRAELDDADPLVLGLVDRGRGQRPTVTAGETLAVVVSVVNRRGLDLSLAALEVGATRDAGMAGRAVRGAFADTSVSLFPQPPRRRSPTGWRRRRARGCSRSRIPTTSAGPRTLRAVDRAHGLRDPGRRADQRGASRQLPLGRSRAGRALARDRDRAARDAGVRPWHVRVPGPAPRDGQRARAGAARRA